jgi:methylmalonyl-CoA mutase
MSDTPPVTPVSFPEFLPVTTAQWQAQLARELKGTDPERLRWTLPDGLVAEPFCPAATWWPSPCPLAPMAASR